MTYDYSTYLSSFQRNLINLIIARNILPRQMRLTELLPYSHGA